MKAIVEIMGADPMHIRERADVAINGWLASEPDVDTDAELDALSEVMWERFAKSVHHTTTGMDGLSITVVRD